ncbi:hypothetical protein EJ05DRAFT_96478 [Pseudovirgaria hyperparasitica]|uniref:Uncharacterized protein n=1 Tax=Pseudovirgaria hyperparasitica TaxID=470096 RepID=A0A6A6W190_9PEZI|nr:uncharacterized protein EJ05DRAFT_96478 [Pseudovirgaria hyperparasitica]KAF2756295.1 hypothetical protein EJ05DRAFT_96478 [Pseudovirgaria hyperparasitica]
MVPLTFFAILFSMFFVPCLTLDHLHDGYHIHESCRYNRDIVQAIEEAIKMANTAFNRLDTLIDRPYQVPPGAAAYMQQLLRYTFGIHSVPGRTNNLEIYYLSEVRNTMGSVAYLERNHDLESSRVRFYCDDDTRWTSVPQTVAGKWDIFGQAVPMHLPFDREQGLDGGEPWRWLDRPPPCRQPALRELSYIRQASHSQPADIVLCHYYIMNNVVRSIESLRRVYGNFMPLSLSSTASSSRISLSTMTSLRVLKHLVEVQKPQGVYDNHNDRMDVDYVPLSRNDYTWSEVVLREYPADEGHTRLTLKRSANYAYFGLLVYLADNAITLYPDHEKIIAGKLIIPTRSG